MVVKFSVYLNKCVFVMVSFQKRFSSSDHLNGITTNINIYFEYLRNPRDITNIGTEKAEVIQIHVLDYGVYRSLVTITGNGCWLK